MYRTAFALLVLASLALAQEGAATEKAKAKPKPDKRAIARIEEVKLKIDGTEDPLPALPFGPRKLNYYGFLRYVKEIAHDSEVDAVLLEIKGYSVGWSRLLEVRQALGELRKSGKKVFVYKESLTTPDLALASVADRISVPESGIVALPGLAIESWYMKDLLAKVRVRFDVIHIGEYKTAGEELVRDSMSPELKESLDPVLDEFYASMCGAIAEGRGLSVDAVKKAIDRGLLTPRQAKEAGLIDRVEYYDQFKDGIKAYFPDKRLKRAKSRLKKGQFQFDANNPMAVLTVVMSSLFQKKTEKKAEGPRVAVVYCTGPIVSGKSQYDFFGNLAAMGSKTIVEAIDKARKDDSVKAIVLRINSPGGSGLASDMIWRAVERAKEAGKPVIASMGDVAASGGYWIAMNSTAILAQPQTITGSIGVVGLVPNVDDFFTWVGIHPERLSRGQRAQGLMTSKGLTEEDKQMLRELMQSFYGDFVAKVAAGRGKTPAEIERIARGRIWTGRTALELGLVDRLGGLEDAVALAREKGGIAGDEELRVLELPRRKGPFDALQEMFEMRVGLGVTEVALREMPELRRALWHLQMLRRVGRDRICVIQPELAGFARAAGR
jgi:protease-4